MKTLCRLGLPLVALLILFSCASAPDPNKNLPQAEYEQAQKLRARIAAFNFSQYAPDEFQAGETAFMAGETSYKKDNAAAKTSFDAAIANYRIVMQKGIAVLSKQKNEDVDLWKKKADNIKASVAVAEDYTAAEETYTKAQALAEEGNWEEAETMYTDAEDKFTQVFEKTKAKKDKAETKYDETSKSLDSIRATQEELDSGM